MNRFFPALAVAVVAGLTLMSGVLHGHMSHRWGPTRDSLAAAKKLESFPKQFGDWQLESSEEMDRDTIEMLQCTGYFSRVYVNRKSGETAHVAVILGPPGQISVHTPEICYSSREFSRMESRKSVAMSSPSEPPEEFWKVEFRRNNSLLEGQLAVYYAWSTGGHWVASQDPRFQFAAAPYLYKIQLAAGLQAGSDPQSEDTCYRFLQEFVPKMREYLVEGAAE